MTTKLRANGTIDTSSTLLSLPEAERIHRANPMFLKHDKHVA